MCNSSPWRMKDGRVVCLGQQQPDLKGRRLIIEQACQDKICFSVCVRAYACAFLHSLCVSLAVRLHAFVPLAFFFPLLLLRLRGLMLQRVSVLLGSQEVSAAAELGPRCRRRLKVLCFCSISASGCTRIRGHKCIQGHSNWLPDDYRHLQWSLQLPLCIETLQPVIKSQ